MQKFKFMGLEIPFDLAKFVNENGQDDKTLDILGVLVVNIIRTSEPLNNEIKKIIRNDPELLEYLKKEVRKDEVLQNSGAGAGIKKDAPGGNI